MEPDMSYEATRYVYDLRGITPPQRAVLVRLADHANDDGKAWPSIRSLAATTSLSLRTVQRALRDLETLGFIRINRRTATAGDPTSNEYELCKFRGGVTVTGGGVTVTGGGVTVTGGGVTVTGLSGIPIESPLNQIPPYPQTGDEVGTSQGEPEGKGEQEPRANPKARKASKRTQARAKHDELAIVLLSELSAARRRCNPACDELRPLPTNLGQLTERLSEGHTADEIRGAIAYLEASVKAGTYKAEHFNAVNPFRRINFGGHLGKSPDSIKPAQPVRQSYHSEAATVIPRGLPDTPFDRKNAELQRQELARKKHTDEPTPSE